MHGELTTLNCICPGYEAVFECVVTGSGATVWSGTALNQCSSELHRIILRHSQFSQPGYSISTTCDDSRRIIAHAVSEVNNSYTSLLTINVSQNSIGANIDCASLRQSGEVSHIGQILLTTGICVHN